MDESKGSSQDVQADAELILPNQSGAILSVSDQCSGISNNTRLPILDVQCGADVTYRAVEWLWQHWLVANKLTLLGGPAGTGKTTLALSMAAILTSGGTWPDGSSCPCGEAIIWSGEDDLEDTIGPRLSIAGADMTRVHLIRGVTQNHQKRNFDPSVDLPLLREAMTKYPNVKLLIIDPLASVIQGDSHKNAEVRRGLQPLVDLGQECGCAILGITHLAKATGGREPLERVIGSVAFGAVARVVLITAKVQNSEETDGTRIVLRAKSNLGPDSGGYRYYIDTMDLDDHPGIKASLVRWGDSIDGTPQELMAWAAFNQDKNPNAFERAKVLIHEGLASGPKSANELIAYVTGAGVSKRTFDRARKELNLKKEKMGMRGGWLLSLDG